MEAGNIKPIGRNSVHKICSGQVVLTLATAVKELVENSLDAEATIIEVKLKEYGSELIEVIDNGKGVKASDFQGITLKHHTSKISDFSDVQFVSTFGFRGEALSSLCALSDLEVVTCHADSAVGSLLVYDRDGALVKSCPTPRQVGTTVIVKNLFYPLPVRHKEFHRNLRREYAKMVQTLTSYCLISVRKRITCTNTTDKGRKTLVLSTNASDTVKDNIACLFSSKQAGDLMEFVQHAPSEAVLEEYYLPASALEKCRMFRLDGFISSCAHGEGRSSADRQFFFINGRPCDLPKISKLINEIYHSFNKAQYPFVFLNVVLTAGSADVNVTPDKRQIFIPDEKLLLCVVKSSLHQMYRLQPSQMKVSSASLFFQKSGPDTSLPKLPADFQKPASTSSEAEEDSLKRKAGSSVDGNQEEEGERFSPPPKSIRKEEPAEECPIRDDGGRVSPDSGFSSQERVSSSPSTAPEASNPADTRVALTLPFDEERALSGSPNLKDILQKAYRAGGAPTVPKVSRGGRRKALPGENIVRFFSRTSPRKTEVRSAPSHGATSARTIDTCEEEGGDSLVDEPQPRRRKTRTITFSMDAVGTHTGPLPSSVGSAYRKFRSKIAPGENQSAEDELKKEIRKEDFSEMVVIGQFNLGFIVARLHDDLFIVDQHATDEKYNFEVLRRDTLLETQKLLNPQRLQLTAASEAVLLDNLSVFEKSGFTFTVDEGGPVGSKVQLTSVPVSQNWRFGKEDVDEMIFMLTDNPVSSIRPSRVNQMFASRACRKSVMIGTALSTSTMKKLLVHMGEIEQPWNCPHGRPTIRHLFNLNLLKTVAEE